MSYLTARKCFQDNIHIINKPKTDEQTFIWNLSNGLTQLSDAISADLSALESQLSQISQSLERLKSP